MIISGWELALIIFAITVMIVNVTSCVVQIMTLTKFSRLFDKSASFMEKMIDRGEKSLDKLFDDLEE